MKIALRFLILVFILQWHLNKTNAQSSLLISPDSTFGTYGNMILGGGPVNNFQSATDFAIEPNGKFLIVGAVGNAGAQPYIAQYLSNGTPDSSFGTNAFSYLNSFYDRTVCTATGVMLLSNGKILVTGQHDLGSLTSYIVRLKANGIVDSGFGTNGYLNFVNAIYPAMLVLSDGSIVFKYTNNTYTTSYLAEADNTGKLNTQFGGSGTVTLSQLIGNCNITLCQNDEILAAGKVAGGIGLVRYHSNGIIDNTFGQSGIITYTPSSSNTYFVVSNPLPVLQPDNSLVVAMSGGTYLPTYAIHVLANGSIDSTYNNSGLAVSGGGLTTSSIASGISTLNNETLLANNLTFSSFYFGAITALTAGGILDTLSQLNTQNPNFVNFQTTTIKASGANTIFMMGNGSIGYDNVKMFKYNISASPFTINSFTGQKEADSTSLLQWSVASIQNVNHFEILRSIDKITWTTIRSVTANAGTNYSYRDSFPNDNTNYYRIKMIGKTGAYTYSPNIVLITYNFPPANCNSPVPYVYQVTDTSATFKFNSGGNNNISYYQYAYMPSDGHTYTSPPAGLPLFTASATTAHVGGLSAATTYYVFMRSECSSKSPTAWAVSSFKTVCDTAAIPYTELFTSSSFPCIANGPWAQQSNDFINGAALNYGYNSQASGWFFTKRFYLTAGKTYRIYFQYGTINYNTPTQNTSLIAQMATYPDSTSLIGSPLINLTLNTAQNNNRTLDSFALYTPAKSGFYCAGFYSLSSPATGDVIVQKVEVLENQVTVACTTNISPANKTTETNFCNNFQLTWHSVPDAFSYTFYYSSPKFGAFDYSTNADTSATFNLCGDVGDTITWYAVPRVLGQDATGCASTSTVFYTPKFSAPANDLCSNAQTLTVTKGFCTSPVAGNLMGATFSNASDTAGICIPSFVSAEDNSDTSDVWYKLTIPSTGNAVVQVSKFNEASSTSTILRAFKGNCGSLTPIACACDSGQFYYYNVEPYRVRLYLTNQTPGATIFIRVASYFVGGNYFSIGAFDTTSSVSPAIVSAVNTCTPAVTSTLDSLSGKLYMFNPLFSASGQLLGEVNPAGLNFGTVNASLYVNSGAVRTSNGMPYLDRNIQIAPTNTQNPNYQEPGIRLYATPGEINAFNMASGNTVLSNFKVTQNNDNCGPAFINQGTNLGNITDYGLYKGSNYFLSTRSLSFGSYYFFKGDAILPLQFLSFTGQACNSNNVCLNWSTADEVNVSSIIVERSFDGKFFTPFTTVKALGGSGINNYSAADKQPSNGSNFYRLKSVDKDGHFTYCQTIMIQFAVVANVQVVPNPANNFTTIHADHPIKSITLMNAQGQIIQKIITNGDFSQTIQISKYAAGLYYLRIQTSSSTFIKKLDIIR